MAALHKKTRQQIIDLYENGVNKAEIHRQLGISRPTVDKVLREAGLWEPESGTEADKETYVHSEDNRDTGEEEDGEDDEETEEGNYDELTEEEERQVLELYGRRRIAVGEQVADELGLDREAVLEAIEANSPPETLEVPTRSGMLLVGGLLGAGVLYLALLRGLLQYPQPGQLPGSSSSSGSTGAGTFPGPLGGSPSSSRIGR